ncbi:MAG: hypothetical protein M0P31_13560 [Solirubrobacteraceae bacterium]|nr:hypothetical protein [Solirubrobacteraceae bacterium]
MTAQVTVSLAVDDLERLIDLANRGAEIVIYGDGSEAHEIPDLEPDDERFVAIMRAVVDDGRRGARARVEAA